MTISEICYRILWISLFTLVSFIVFSVFLHPKFPRGKRKTIVNNGWTTHIIGATEDVQFACHKAHLVVIDAIRQSAIPNQLQVLDKISEICFYFIPENSSKSHMTYIPTRFGFRIPLIVIRKKVHDQITNGATPIMGLIQILESEGNKKLYWKLYGGSESIQAKAEELFITYKE